MVFQLVYKDVSGIVSQFCNVVSCNDVLRFAIVAKAGNASFFINPCYFCNADFAHDTTYKFHFVSPVLPINVERRFCLPRPSDISS